MVRGRPGFKGAAVATVAGALLLAAAPTMISAQDDEAPPPATETPPVAEPPGILPPLRLAESARLAPVLPPPPPPVRVPADVLRGAWVRIQDPAASLGHFHRRLAAASRGDPDAVVRVAVYSDSINGADWVTHALRRGLQARFGDAGKGFVPLARGWPSQAHRAVVMDEGPPWETEVVNHGRRADGRYGLGGVAATGRGWGARTTYRLPRPAERVDVLYARTPRGGGVRVLGPDPPGRERPPELARVSTRLPEGDDPPSDGILRVPLEPGGVREITVGWAPTEPPGPTTVYGVVLERGGPGVVVDALMLIGAFARTLLRFGDAHWREQVALRQPDLLVFWMGGNDAVSTSMGFSPSRFVDGYSEAITQARSGRPSASCLVVSVIDSGERDEAGRARTQRRVPRVVAAQEEVAARTGCAFFDLFRALGGPGTMARWVRGAAPKVSGDLKHLTPRGAAFVGGVLERALLRSYDDWLAAGARPPPDEDVGDRQHR